ncbi:MAG: FAD-dependent oxidoreductase [Victivallales bacterium]|nr:FAD-dependent oxidoreductase [Victivallales bacterium]
MTKEEKYIEQTVRCRVLAEADVIVCGGGTAGVVAAIAAARNGARTVLVEGQGSLGGMMTFGNAGITMFTKYSGSREEHDKDEQTLKTNPEAILLVGGIPVELVRRLMANGNAVGNEGVFSSYILTDSEEFKRVLFQMMKEAGVELQLHSMIVDVIQKDGRLGGVVIESKSGREFLPGKIVIDTTGDGDVAAKAGVPYWCGVSSKDICASPATMGACAPVGVMFKVANVDLQKTFDYLERNPDRYVEHPFSRFSLAAAKRNLEKGDNCTSCIKFSEGEGWFQIYNTPHRGVVTICCPCVKNIDGLDSRQLSHAEAVIAEMVGHWVERIREQIPGFEEIFLIDCPQIGVRETRHIEGDYVLTALDMYNSRHFDDCIGFGSHPFDINPRPEWLKEPEKAYRPRWSFEIPYRCLIASKVSNLLLAGRCISATHEASGSIRTTVQCMITGEAAGTAAALAVKQSVSPRELSAEVLRGQLIAQGAKC